MLLLRLLLPLGIVVNASAAMAQPSAPDIQGHRGARGLMPENTLAAFAHALRLGVDTLELDVGLTADGVVVVSHDRRLNPDLVRRPDGRWLARRGPPDNPGSPFQSEKVHNKNRSSR